MAGGGGRPSPAKPGAGVSHTAVGLKLGGHPKSVSSRRSSPCRCGARSGRICPVRSARGPPIDLRYGIGSRYVIGCGAGSGRHRPRRRPPPPPTHRWGAGGSRGVPRARARVGVRHAAARGRVGLARRGARGALPSALCVSLAVELVRGRHRPRRRPLPPSTHRWGAGGSRGDPRHARLHLRHRRRLRPRHRRRRRGPQLPHPLRACVARDRASARHLHGGFRFSLATP